MMEQYLLVKKEYKDYILFYRLGDFYEMFYEDALTASRALDLTLTSRDCGNGNRAAMCGVPFHKADVYIGNLVEQGFKVAICEQTEDPSQAVGLVKREVIREITPGTVTDGELLNDGKNNYLATMYFAKNGIGLAFADISTGQISTTHIYGDNVYSRAQTELGIYTPRELITNISKKDFAPIAEFLENKVGCLISDSRDDLFTQTEIARVREIFGDEADSASEAALYAAGAIIGYIQETQMCNASFVKSLNVYTDGQYMQLDLNTRRNLELTETMRQKDKRGSLLWVLDKTKTAMGARLLRSFIVKPLLNPAVILSRQASVGDFVSDTILRGELRERLSPILDLERLMAKVVYETANAKDLRAICQSISLLPEIRELIRSSNAETVKESYADFDTLSDIYELLDNAIVENPPYSLREGKMIKSGYNADVDYLRSVHENGKAWVEELEEKERGASGIKTLKVGYNKVFGYYIEVTKSLIDQVPDRYIRKQTLSNCERYITEELKNMESTVLGAEDKLCALEFSLFCELRSAIAKEAPRIQATASAIAELDVYLSLAEVATKNNYVCPEISLSGDVIIKDGRHPVVEKYVSDSYFVPNDTEFDSGKNRLMLITGPNMAGKSTYMRQVALIVLMAQMGSYVPASEAKIGIVDRIFTRVGASDDLASGQSTFMLEMNEVAEILKNATKDSLIIYDEVGRGTSTYDGMSIARAVVEYTNSKIKAKTMFATHYHELTSMEGEYEGIVNYNITAKKKGDTITFLRRVVRGAADESYGIEVAKLAGVPNEIVKRAKEILSGIESGEVATEKPHRREKEVEEPLDMISMLYDSQAREVVDKLRRLDINVLTPIEAMNVIYEIKKEIGNE
ncbi:MAG: DNA mismatch repair protein MutS [Clostridia bacterium]|nr:DNA mismatch repair protein MutS [Clostridia bacterium]